MKLFPTYSLSLCQILVFLSVVNCKVYFKETFDDGNAISCRNNIFLDYRRVEAKMGAIKSQIRLWSFQSKSLLRWSIHILFRSRLVTGTRIKSNLVVFVALSLPNFTWYQLLSMRQWIPQSNRSLFNILLNLRRISGRRFVCWLISV